MSKFLHAAADDDAKAIAMTRVFSENSQAKNAGYQHFLLFQQYLKTNSRLISSLWPLLILCSNRERKGKDKETERDRKTWREGRGQIGLQGEKERKTYRE